MNVAGGAVELPGAKEMTREQQNLGADGAARAPRTAVRVGTRRLFLSCVSQEFRSYRDVLAANLAQPGVELQRQEDFINAGRTTLEKLDDYIRTCDAVIHLVGDSPGAYPEPAESAALLAQRPGLAEQHKLDLLLSPPGLSYTQWEAWLAIEHGKPLALYRAAPGAQREPGFTVSEPQRARQELHWQHLLALGRDRKEFLAPQDLSVEVLRALPLLVPAFTENLRRGQARDRNLLFAVLALQDDILGHEAFVRVCRRWAEDIEQSMADTMEREGLLIPEDRALVEARVERKLKHRQGDVRQSLADSLGSDARNSLGESLDPESLAALPDRFAGLHGLASADSRQWRYRLTRTHGVGGLGVVSVASDAALERQVAFKQMRPERMLDPMAMDRFVREARITGRLQHPNIVPVYELGLTPDDQLPFYTMRFVGHQTLQQAIVRHHQEKDLSDSDRNLRFRGLLQAFLAVCHAVGYAHQQQVIHRDIKPANIMIGEFGEVILLDWGLAKRLDEAESVEPLSNSGVPTKSDHSQAGTILGSPAYMAPEQAAGRIDLHDTRTDVYGLGVTLYEILTGEVPFGGASTEELLVAIQFHELRTARKRNPLVPVPLSAICQKAIERNPANRYATAQALASDIQHWLADEPVSVHRDDWSVRIARIIGRYPVTTTATVAGMLGGVLALAILFSTQFFRAFDASITRTQADITMPPPIRKIEPHELTRLVFAAGSATEAQALREVQRAYRQTIEVQEFLVAARPDLPQLAYDLAHFYEHSARLAMRTGDYRMALDSYAKAVDLRLKVVPSLKGNTTFHDRLAIAYGDMAWIYATCPDAAIRNGAKAVTYALKAGELKHSGDANYLDTLAASQAEAGDFERAVLTAEQAVAAAPADLKVRVSTRAALFRTRTSYHEEESAFPSKVHE